MTNINISPQNLCLTCPRPCSGAKCFLLLRAFSSPTFSHARFLFPRAAADRPCDSPSRAPSPFSSPSRTAADRYPPNDRFFVIFVLSQTEAPLCRRQRFRNSRSGTCWRVSTNHGNMNPDVTRHGSGPEAAVFYKPRPHQPGLQMAGRHIPVASTPFKWPCCHADRAYSHVQSIILLPWFENLLRDPPNIFLRGGQLIDDEYINRLGLGDFCPRQQGGKSIASARYPPRQPAAKSATGRKIKAAIAGRHKYS